MYFSTKNYLKSNYNHSTKQALSAVFKIKQKAPFIQVKKKKTKKSFVFIVLTADDPVFYKNLFFNIFIILIY